MEKLSIDKVSGEKELVSIRAKIQYVASCTRSDVSSAVQMLASLISKPTEATFQQMNGIVGYCKSSVRSLKYAKLDIGSLRLIVFTDAAFANAKNERSKLGDRWNIVHCGSIKCKRVARSVMAAEIMALIYGFDASFVVKHTLEAARGQFVPLDTYIDSRTTFSTIAKSSNTLEKRLQIDVSAISESHKKGELKTLGTLLGDVNQADGLTRDKILKNSHPLCNLLHTNRNEYCRKCTGATST